MENPKLGGLFLDTRPSEPNKALQMETQHVPAFLAKDAKGDTYARIAPTHFPATPEGDAPLVHRITAYRKAALWDGVKSWFEGGMAVTGAIDPKASGVHTFSGKGGATWRIYPPDTERDKKVPLAWNSFATPSALDETTYGYKWSPDAVSKDGSVVTLPEYYRLGKDPKKNDTWVVVNAKDVPARDRAGEGGVPEDEGNRSEALRHAGRRGQLLEESGAGGRAIPGDARRRQ